MHKILRVDMTLLTLKEESVKQEYQYLGGRAFTSRLVSDEVDPCCHPLGKHNKLVIAPGLLTGTFAPCSGRLSIGGKSPLTGTIKESNVGGTASQKISYLGYKAIVVEGCSEQGMFILRLSPNGGELLKADYLEGSGTYQTAQILQEKYGSRCAVICIGPAGENKLSISSIAVTDMDGNTSRHAGRGGLGAVMGSKGIKAIVVDSDKNSSLRCFDEVGFKSIASSFAKELIESKKVMTMLGTASLVTLVNSLKGLPTRNFSSGEFEGASRINGETLRALITQRNGKTGHPCHPGCVIRCSNIYNDKDGHFLTAGFEYETIALVGSNCGIDDLDVIAKVDRFCDDFGLDSMDTGVAIGVLMESGYLNFGDKEGLFKLLYEIKKLSPLGRILASGAEITGKVFSVTRVPTVKGQALSAYDPRVFKGTGVTYATSPMGADHTAATCLPGRGGYRNEVKDGSQIKFNEGGEMPVYLSADLQTMVAVCDSLGFCYFVGASPTTMRLFAELINKRYGLELNGEDMIEIGQEVIQTELEFNKKAGFSTSNDTLPEFFREERLEPAGEIFDVDQKYLNKAFDFLQKNSAEKTGAKN